MNTDETGFFAGKPPHDNGFYAGEPRKSRVLVSLPPSLIVRLAVGTARRLVAGLAVAVFCYIQCRPWWQAWYLRYKYDPPWSLGPIYFLVNASTADDWIGYTLLAVVVVCFLAFVVWPTRWTALLACLVALCWVVPGCDDAMKRKLPWQANVAAEDDSASIV
jgi:hypothetical protein